MKQAKFSLADVLTVLAAIGFGFFCFLSWNFLTQGDTIQSVIVAVIFALILGGMGFVIKSLKKVKGGFQNAIMWERIMLLLFVCISAAGVFFFSHFFVVSENKKAIQGTIVENIEQAEGMYAEYEDYAANRESIYKSNLNSVVAGRNVNRSRFRDYGFVDGVDTKEQVENKILTLQFQLFPSNYKEMKQNNTTSLSEWKNAVERWAPIGVVDVVNVAEQNIKTWEEELAQLSTFKAQGEIAEDFDFPLTFDDVTNRFEGFWRTTPQSVLYAIGLCLLMLLSYVISKRNTKSPYSLFSFLKKKKSEKQSRFDIEY